MTSLVSYCPKTHGMNLATLLGVLMLFGLPVVAGGRENESAKAAAEENDAGGQPISECNDLPAQLNAAWVKRLTDSKSTNAVHLLERAFRKHQKTEGRVEDVYLDAEIVHALSTIPGKMPGDVLIQLVTEVRKQGPRNRTQPWRDERYMSTMHTAIRFLGMRGGADSLRVLQQLHGTTNLQEGLKSEAYRWCMKRELAQQDVEGSQETVSWLYEEYIKSGGQTCPVFVTLAIEGMLSRLGPKAVPALEALHASTVEERGPKYWGVLWLRHIIVNIKDDAEHGHRPLEPGIPYWRDQRGDAVNSGPSATAGKDW